MKALEECDGDILDAVSLLECKGVINRTSAAYNPNKKTAAPNYSSAGVNLRKENTSPPPHGTGSNAEKIGTRIKELLKKSVVYSFNIYYGEKKWVSMPVIAIIILAVFAFGATFAILAVGLIAGCRYEIAEE